MGTTATRITAKEFFAATVEGDRKQLVDGVMVPPEARPLHGLLQVRLLTALANWIAAGRGRGLVLPPVDVILDEYNVYGPDLVWIAERHRPRDMNMRLARVPELCVEIRSPGTWRYDVALELGGSDTLTSPQLPALELALDDLFRD